jgi:3-phenylpropionate/cinnamic acid dioxygenase small subunit
MMRSDVGLPDVGLPDVGLPDGRMMQIAALNGACAAAIDSGRLEEWPGFFLDRCLYKVTTADNHEKGYQAGLIYADSRAMLADRIAALREANIYEKQRYRHVLGLPLITGEADGAVAAETSFLVVRTMRDGQMMIFAAGVYLDRLCRDGSGAWRYAERIVVCDSQRFDTLLAIPL